MRTLESPTWPSRASGQIENHDPVQYGATTPHTHKQSKVKDDNEKLLELNTEVANEHKWVKGLSNTNYKVRQYGLSIASPTDKPLEIVDNAITFRVMMMMMMISIMK